MSKAIFVTWIGVPPSQVLLVRPVVLSMSSLKVRLPDNHRSPLSWWWVATSTTSKAIFVTWIGVPPQVLLVLILSISNLPVKVRLPHNRRCPLRLRVSFLFSFEVSRAMIYNDQHQCHQLSRYLPIPLLSILIMIQTDPQALQVILIIKKQV